MVPWLTTYCSASTESITTCRTVPPRLGSSTVGIQSGKCFGTCFWYQPSPSVPSGKRWSTAGRSAMKGSMRSAMRPA